MFGLRLYPSAVTSPEGASLAKCRSIVEVGAYNAVKNATCSKQCLEGGLLQACPAQAPAPAPSPAYAQALATLQAGAPAPGARSEGPLNGLSSALQAGSPPRYPPETVPQVLMQRVLACDEAVPLYMIPRTACLPVEVRPLSQFCVLSRDIQRIRYSVQTSALQRRPQ